MATKTETKQQLSGVQLYSRFALAGAVCCSVTHGALTPVDVYVLTGPLGCVSSS
jgi:solute carrier family 25 phosphate transporter 3